MSDHTDIEQVRRDLPQIVADLDQGGGRARPVVFGSGHPQAVLISAEQYRYVVEALDDLHDAALVREREEGVDVQDLPSQSVEELAEELGVGPDAQDRP